MHKMTSPESDFPNNGGHDDPIHEPIIVDLHEIIAYFKFLIFGMLFVRLGINRNKAEHVQRSFKMGGANFIQRVNIRQTVKYGAIMYITVAMLAMPAGLRSHQHLPPALASFQLPSFITLMNDLAQISISGVAQKQETPQVQPEKEASPFQRHVLAASQTYQVDAALIRAIIMAESSNNPQAVSHRGAQGLMQLMPTTAKWLGVEDSFDPALNIDGGVRYLRQLLDRFDGDVSLALAAYNAGSRHVRNYGGVPPFKATRIYIQKVLKYRQYFQKEMAGGQLAATAS
jgi:soluble lytic murein transglycosylase-like protein